MITKKQPKTHPHINLKIGETLEEVIKGPYKTDINILSDSSLYYVEFLTGSGYNPLIMRGYEIKDRVFNPALFFTFWNDSSYMTVNVAPDWRKN